MLSGKEKNVQKALMAFQERLSRDASPFADNSGAAQKQRYESTRHSTQLWGEAYMPHYFSEPSALYHADLDALMNFRGKYIFPVHGPREHGKSARVRVALLRKLLNGEISYFVFCSEHLFLAKAHIMYIYMELTDNVRIVQDYEIKIISFDQSEGKLQLVVKHKAARKKKRVMFQATSYGTSSKGLLFINNRPDGAIVDDFENTRTSRNKRISQEKLDWILQELYGAVTGPIIWLGNIGHDSSALYLAMLKIYGSEKRLKNFLRYGSTPGEFAGAFGYDEAPKQLPEEMRVQSDDPEADGSIQMHPLSFRAITVMPDGHTRYLWPERFSPEWYQNAKATLGHLYEGENNGYPVKIGKLFKPEFSVEYDKLPSLTHWLTWFDPAFGKSGSSCYKAWVIMASEDGRDFYIVDAYCRQGTDINEAIDAWYKAFEKYETHGLRYGLYENNFGQDDRIEEVLDRHQLKNGYRLNVAGQSNAGNKQARIESMEPAWNLKSFHWPREMNHDVAALYDQCIAYPDGEYIDGPDALESCYVRLRRNCRTSGSGAQNQASGARRYGFRIHRKKQE